MKRISYLLVSIALLFTDCSSSHKYASDWNLLEEINYKYVTHKDDEIPAIIHGSHTVSKSYPAEIHLSHEPEYLNTPNYKIERIEGVYNNPISLDCLIIKWLSNDSFSIMINPERLEDLKETDVFQLFISTNNERVWRIISLSNYYSDTAAMPDS